MKKKIGIYIHIPFCIKKCNYCDFLSFPIAGNSENMDKKAGYLKALEEEIAESKAYLADYEADTVFFGGGTPSILSGDEIERMLCKLRENVSVSKDAEISLECNPGTADAEKLKKYRSAGVNRLSIGLQSANDSELKVLGRIHTFSDFFKTYHLAREKGFANINIDLMSGIPLQSMETYRETLDKVLELKPEHISAYSLIVEEGTPFYDCYGTLEGEKDLPGEELDRRMYSYTQDRLKQAGLNRYEISNYALEGYECRHNIKYWKLHEYVGFGLGSASFFEGKRVKNPTTFEQYVNTSIRQSSREIENLSKTECMEEFMFLGLRMMKGVSKKEFYQKFEIPVEELYATVIDKYVRQQLLIQDSHIRLTDRGIDVSNMIMADFLL